MIRFPSSDNLRKIGNEFGPAMQDIVNSNSRKEGKADRRFWMMFIPAAFMLALAAYSTFVSIRSNRIRQEVDQLQQQVTTQQDQIEQLKGQLEAYKTETDTIY